MNLGISGRLTRATIKSPLTPLFLLAAIVFGIMAVITIPREEEPQISVPMVDIFVQANGLKAGDAAEQVTKPLEEIVKGINGVEHVYSQTQDDRVMVTARFFTGTNEDDAILRVQAKLRANYDRIPLGIPEPLIVGRGINDVAIVTLTLSPKPEAAGRWNEQDLYTLATKLQAELVKTDNVGLTYIAGGAPEEISVEPDPEKLALYGVTLQQLEAKIQGANRSVLAGQLRENGKMMEAVAGRTLSGVPDIGLLLVTTRDGRPVYVRDLAKVVIGASPAEHHVWNIARHGKGWATGPAVTVAFAKRAGANAVVVADSLVKRLDTLKGNLIPKDVSVEVTRDYGKTANDKANELLFHLALATISIVLLIGFAIGWREAGVTLIVIPTTILLTLFAANVMGYTINRVSLFALIFSIGILVDDAIVVVENIARHWAMNDGRTRMQAAIEAVAEVGNPTVVATLTVVAALLPMLFVSGMMGPYMAPIPANASAAMLFSFFVAMVIAPWALAEIRRQGHGRAGGRASRRRTAGRVLPPHGRAHRALEGQRQALPAVCRAGDRRGLHAVRHQRRDGQAAALRQQVRARSDGRSAGRRDRRGHVAGAVRGRARHRETARGEIDPGLCRHARAVQFQRPGAALLSAHRSRRWASCRSISADKADRDRESHAIALDLRKRLDKLAIPQGHGGEGGGSAARPAGALDAARRNLRPRSEDAPRRGRRGREAVQIGALYRRCRQFLWAAAAAAAHLHRSGQARIFRRRAVRRLRHAECAAGRPAGRLFASRRRPQSDPDRGARAEEAISAGRRSWPPRRCRPTPSPATRRWSNSASLCSVTEEKGAPVIFRRDGHYADMVTGELAGEYEAPIYGMFAVDKLIADHDWGKLPKPAILFHGQPTDERKPSLLWDGEWEVTYVTFRDMGAAFIVALLAIYVLVVAQFKSFKLPLVILTPVPLTLIGIVLGHWLFGAPFTATSMIGFIALAGIIVRNSILLVDFIRHGAGESGKTLREVLLDAGATRFRPILLTALAAMIGAATILTDPIFQGLAISLLFGLASSTLLTVLVIPAIYVWLRDADAPIVTTPEN